jgi:hypothetical protein
MTGLVKRGLSVSVVLASISFIQTVELRVRRELVKWDRPPVRIERPSQPEVVLLDDSVPTDVAASLVKADSNRQFVVLRQPLHPGTARISAVMKEQLAMDWALESVEQDGVKYVVVTDFAPPAGEDGLRAIVRSDPHFRLLGSFPFRTNDRGGQMHNLYLYENPSTPTQHIPARVVTLKENTENDDGLPIG